MAQRFRPGLTAEHKREMWSRWKAGQSLSEIGRERSGGAQSGVCALVVGAPPQPMLGNVGMKR